MLQSFPSVDLTPTHLSMKFLIATLSVLLLASIALADLQMKGIVRSPDTNTFYFDVLPSTECQLAASTQGYGDLYLGVSSCENGTITVVLMESCTALSTYPYTNSTTPIGQYWVKENQFFRLHGFSYTEVQLQCYEPTPAQIIPPPVTPVSATTPTSGGPSSPSSQGGSASTISASIMLLGLGLLMATVL